MPDEATPPLRDAALARAFAGGLPTPLTRGATGVRVVALQYALGRLGHLTALADGQFGPRTLEALRAFQRAHALAATGSLDLAALRALDDALSRDDGRTPAARASNPIAYLSNFSAFGLTRVELVDRAAPASWTHPEIAAAYGRFVDEYWEVLKRNRVEADCKTLALFFMDQFRAKARADASVSLPLPRSTEATLGAALRWRWATTRRPAGYFQRVEQLTQVRPGFESVGFIERLDPAHSMLEGVNVLLDGLTADRVARAAQTVVAWDASRDNGGDVRRAEVPIDALEAGAVVFLDHGAGTWDHTVNVVRVTRDARGRVTELRLAVGSFDDMKDADRATAPANAAEVDLYAEEVTVRFADDGRIARSFVSWASEPRYEVAPRYDATTTLMDLHRGARLKVGRWA